jgi:hypothetical protein
MEPTYGCILVVAVGVINGEELKNGSYSFQFSVAEMSCRVSALIWFSWNYIMKSYFIGILWSMMITTLCMRWSVSLLLLVIGRLII